MPAKINVPKLLDLRARHKKLHADVRAAGDRRRALATELEEARVAAQPDTKDDTSDEDAAALIFSSSAVLEKVTPDEAGRLGLDLRSLRRIAALASTLGSAKQEADELAARFADSCVLMDRVNAYAKNFSADV